MKNQIIALLLFVLASNAVSAQWENMGAGINVGERYYWGMSVVDEFTIWAIPFTSDFTPNFEFTLTTNGCLTWQQGSLPSTIGNYTPIHIFALNNQVAWVTMVNVPSQDRAKVFKTVDGGATWAEQILYADEEGYAVTTVHFFNANEGVGFGSGGTGTPIVDSLRIYRTANGGADWNRIPAGSMPPTLPSDGVWLYSGNGVYDAKGDTLWFGTRTGRVFRTTNKGITWQAYDTGIGTGLFPEIVAVAFENAANGIAIAQQPNRAARTTDGGETWTQISVPSTPLLGAITHIPGTQDTYLAHDGFGGSPKLLLTRNGGATWETQSHTPSMSCIQFISPTVGFGGSDINPANNTGFYRWILGDLSDPIIASLPNAPNMYEDWVQVAPNPATHTLNVTLAEQLSNELLMLKVSALNGQTLLTKQAHNTQNITLSVADLPAGMYILSITNQQTTITKPFVKKE